MAGNRSQRKWWVLSNVGTCLSQTQKQAHGYAIKRAAELGTPWGKSGEGGSHHIAITYLPKQCLYCRLWCSIRKFHDGIHVTFPLCCSGVCLKIGCQAVTGVCSKLCVKNSFCAHNHGVLHWFRVCNLTLEEKSWNCLNCFVCNTFGVITTWMGKMAVNSDMRSHAFRGNNPLILYSVCHRGSIPH